MNIGASYGDPRAEFFIRENANSALGDPLTWYHADQLGRDLSRENESGFAEMVTLVGSEDRPGDPDQLSTLFIVFMYKRGRRLSGGRRATFLSGHYVVPPGIEGQITLSGSFICYNGIPLVFTPPPEGRVTLKGVPLTHNNIPVIFTPS